MILKKKFRYPHLYALPVLLLLAVFALPETPEAGVFRVSPIRLDLDSSVKTGLVTVLAEGPGPLNIQLAAFEWTQDADGKDVYTKTQDLIFFPRMATLEAGTERTVRAGIKTPPGAKEKTYRLFIEEIPERKSKAGANVSMAIRFGLPIFVRPAKEKTGAKIIEAWQRDGSAGVTVLNTGNVHLVVTSVDMTGIDAGGAEVFSQRLGGWYLLAGATRPYTATIPEKECMELRKIKIEIITDRLNLDTTIEADNAECAP
jgi:fimbrial chaperone protein